MTSRDFRATRAACTSAGSWCNVCFLHIHNFASLRFSFESPASWRNAWGIELFVHCLSYRSAPPSAEMLPPNLLPFAGLISLLVECLTFHLRMVTFYLADRKSFFRRAGGVKSDLSFCMFSFLLSAEMLCVKHVEKRQ